MRAALLLLASMFAAPSSACTLCHSDTAALVRAALLDTMTLPNLLAFLAPLPPLAAAVAWVGRRL